MNKQKKAIIYIITITLLISLFTLYYSYLKSEKQAINRILHEVTDSLLENSLELIENKDNTSLYLIKDVDNYVHFVMMGSNQIIMNSKVKGEYDLSPDHEIVWYNQHINQKNKYAFYGVIYNNDIVKLTVNNSELKIIDYQGYQVFFTSTKFDVPINIIGYAKSDEIIYKN